MTAILAQDHATEPGCYVGGHHGIYAVTRLFEQFSDSPKARRLANAYDRGWTAGGELWEAIYDLADQLEQELNDSLPDNRTATWHDGEFFILPYCGTDDCGSEDCGCQA